MNSVKDKASVGAIPTGTSLIFISNVWSVTGPRITFSTIMLRGTLIGILKVGLDDGGILESTESRGTAKTEAAQIIDQARQRANQMVEDAKGEARDEGERLVEAARGEIEQEMNRAKEGLRAQVSALVISGAEQVLESSVDASRHSEMLDRLAAEL